MDVIDNLVVLANRYYDACTLKKIAKKEDGVIDLTDIHDLSYSAIMRDLRKQCSQEVFTQFLIIYKQCFDRLVDHEVKDPAKLALSLALKLFTQSYDVKMNIQKEASVTELGEATRVGQYLADIIKFTLTRISAEKRAAAMNTVMRKIYLLNENNLAMKHMPPSSSMGQAITFVKHVLFAHPPQYIREVLNNIVAHLRY